MNIWTFLLILLVGLGKASGPVMAQSAPDGTPILIGQITHVEGQLLRYVPEEQDWVVTMADAPFGLDDALYTTRNSRTEIRLPNRNLIRLNDRTQIQLIALEEEFTEIDLYSGTARFFHQGAGTVRVYTPFGYVLASPGAVFDLHSGEKATEVQAFQGGLEFRPSGSQSRYRVEPGRSALIADGKQVLSGYPEADPGWHSWNFARDQAAARYRAYPGESVRYLPAELDYQAPVLDENGRWEQVPYEGEVYYFWRPSQVVSGWAPFTFGRWTVWHDDPCWIPAEPFGYVTHHYGNWFFIRGYWYWAPPVRVRHRPHPAPLFYLPWAWYPGRVAWIHHGTTIGWIPLAPHEPYYCRRPWGPRAVVVKDPISVSRPVSRYRHAHQAVTVHRDNFFAVNNYHSFRLPPLKRESIVKDFQPLPVLEWSFLTGADPLRRQYHYTTAVIREKPRPASLDRIWLNQKRFQEAERTRGAPEARRAGQPASGVRPEPRPEARPPAMGTPETVRKRDLPDRFRTPPPAAPAGRESSAPEVGQRTGPGGKPESERVVTPPPAPLRSGAGRERLEPGKGRRATPERIKEPPAPRELPRDRGPGDSRPAAGGRAETPPGRPAIQEPPTRKRNVAPPPREPHRDRAGESRPAPGGSSEIPAPGPEIRQQPVRKRTRDAGPGTKPSGDYRPGGLERSEPGGRGPKDR